MTGPDPVDVQRSIDPAQLLTVLGRLIDWHRQAGHRVATLLRPGLASDAIADRLAAVGLAPTPELTALYGWHDGTDTADGLEYPLVWYHRFLPLDEALALRRDRIAGLGADWPADWLPVFDFEGESYAVACPRDSHAGGPVYFTFLEDTEFPPVYLSLTRMLETQFEGLRGCGGRGSDHGYALELDLADYARLHGLLNPGLRFPYAVP